MLFFIFFPSCGRTHTHTRTLARYWRLMLMAIHYWKGNRLNMTGVCYGELLFLSSILQGIFVSQRCEFFLFPLFVCSRRRLSLLSVVFVSVTVLITKCLIFQSMGNGRLFFRSLSALSYSSRPVWADKAPVQPTAKAWSLPVRKTYKLPLKWLFLLTIIFSSW